MVPGPPDSDDERPVPPPPGRVTGQPAEPCARPRAADDFELLRLAGEGDRGAWQALYLRHRDFVFRTAYRFLGDEHDARDVVQDVFVTLFGRARGYSAGGRFTSLLFRVTANRCLNEQARAHRKGHESDEALQAMPEPAERAPDRLLDARRAQARVRAAIQALPERQRLAVVLSRFEGLSYEEIAEAMGTSVPSVESLLFRARRTLAATLADPAR